MTRIILSQKDVAYVLQELAIEMNTQVASDFAEWHVRIPPMFGFGNIHGFSYDGLSMMILDGFFDEELQLDFMESDEQPLRMSYCIKGSFFHFLNHRRLSYQLENMTSSITANAKTYSESFNYPAKEPLLITHLMIDRKKYFYRIEDELPTIPKPLEDAFEDLEATETFFYRGNYNTRITDCIHSIQQSTHEGLVRSIFMESKVLELLYSHLQQYEKDFRFPRRRSPLKKRDTELILKARDILIKNIAQNITIPELAKQAGINRQKLKMGFKVIFNKTIGTYLREERLERARQLLATGTMTIKETAEQVGYSNQSHFARRFKEKFGMLPKQFLKNIHM